MSYVNWKCDIVSTFHFRYLDFQAMLQTELFHILTFYTCFICFSDCKCFLSYFNLIILCISLFFLHHSIVKCLRPLLVGGTVQVYVEWLFD